MIDLLNSITVEQILKYASAAFIIFYFYVIDRPMHKEGESPKPAWLFGFCVLLWMIRFVWYPKYH